MSYVIGVDTGGTFTDAFAADDSRRIASAKSASTPPNFADGFLAAIDELAASMNLSTAELLGDTGYIVHGTTSTLNSLVTGDVAEVGFITTRGHADSISIMNVEGRYAGLGADQIQNMSATSKPQPLIPRRRVREVNERTDYKGAEIVELDEEGVRRDVRELIADGVEAVAVSLLWSFRDPSHERRIREILAEEAPGLYVALSSDVSPRIREYPRSVTTIMNTQVGPRLRAYLAPLEADLRNRGFTGALLVMQGSGGCVTAENAPANAISTIGSVLTGGIVGCQQLAAALEHENIISTDMGGTTFLVGLILDGEAVKTSSTVLNQYTISSPMVDVHTIGAGGGAIAWVDAGGNLKVGPRSAGASPGPACYGSGGTEPTVTDADLVLGIVNPDYFLGGRKTLSKALAENAIRAKIAEPLGLTVDEAAGAIYAIQNAQTTDLVRKVVVESGQDPRDFVVYAYGGAGPMHCASYSADLGVREVIVPLGPTAAVFSAFGLAASDIILTAEHSQPDNMPVDPNQVKVTFDRLEQHLRTQLAAQDLEFSEIRFEREADIRYTMQLAEVSVPVSSGTISHEDVALLSKNFEERYEQRFGKGSGFPDAGIQIITYRLRAVGCLAIRPELPAFHEGSGAPVPRAKRQVFLDVIRRWEETPIYHYLDLGVGDKISGPAVMEAPTTTVALPAGCHAVVDRLGNLSITY
jgi:N-methylhydantoinase A